VLQWARGQVPPCPLDEMTRDAASRYRRDDVLKWVLEQHSEMPRRSQGRVPNTDPTSEEAHLMKWVQEQDPDAHKYSRRT